MRLLTGLGVAAGVAWAACAPWARAAPSLDLRGVAARVVVVPEARDDVIARVLEPKPRFPLRLHRVGDRLVIAGDAMHRIQGCPAPGESPAVTITGRGGFDLADLPRVVVRAPRDVRITANGAVFGVVGRSASLDLVNRGCGAWTVANVGGRLRISQAGGALVRTGSAAQADLSVAGAGQIYAGAVTDGAAAVSSGAGAITIAALSGPFNARVAGSGEIRVEKGNVSHMVAAIAGSGAVRFGGVAGDLQASVAGSGMVSVATVRGAVSRRVFGAGLVRVGGS